MRGNQSRPPVSNAPFDVNYDTGGDMSRNTTLYALLTLIALALPTGVSAQRSFIPISIPMRDGKSLAADLYASDTTVRKPTILIQTPYNKIFYRLGDAIPTQAGGSSFPSDTLHYNYVVVDWRGFYASAGAAVAGYDRGLDGYDCVEWIAARTWSDGAVGTWGPSALGAIQYMTAKHRPPHLRCAVPVVQDYKTEYSEDYYGGVLKKEYVASIDSLGFTSMTLVTAHPTNDLFWRAVEAASDHPDSFAVPMLLIGGWYDHNPDGVMRAFEDLRSGGAPEVRALHRLIMGPWIHSGVGKVTQGELEYPGADTVANAAALAFFDRYLRGIPNGADATPLVRYYQMGENAWRATDRWESVPTGTDTLYLASGLQLRAEPESEITSASFRFDPRDPSPSVGGARFNPFDRSATVGPYDQRSLVESRADVLAYSTPVLDRDLAVDGPVRVELAVASDRTDTDIMVRLCDVYPDGRSMILTRGARRLRFRNGVQPADTGAITPGVYYPVTIDLQNIGITFLRGHRLRLDISSSDYPFFDANPNSGGPLYKPTDTLVASNSVRQGSVSRIILPVISSTAGVVDVNDARPATALRLDPPAPNPTRGDIRFTLHVATREHLDIVIESLIGQRVATLYEGEIEAGERSFTYDGAQLPAGTYVCRASTAGASSARLVTIVR